MQVKIEEYDQCFSIDFVPEDVKDMAIILRMKSNGKMDFPDIYAYVSRDLAVSVSIIFKKRKDVTSCLVLGDD